MYKIKVISNFSAAHSLRGYKGKCESLHGHNWKVEVLASSEKLNSLGMVIDFHELKRITNKVLEELDHKHINELEYFSKVNPSSEAIARYIFSKLKKIIAKQKCKLEEVLVWETENSCAAYSE
ncbi:MAG: 6-carboxytetrahydropterin synthase QueD [Candidatus Omnitrophota bacterium]|nr:6-carboxytetrahydropterin synthase QueD [Candidatus Omnitrophota bacterium]